MLDPYNICRFLLDFQQLGYIWLIFLCVQKMKGWSNQVHLKSYEKFFVMYLARISQSSDSLAFSTPKKNKPAHPNITHLWDVSSVGTILAIIHSLHCNHITVVITVLQLWLNWCFMFLSQIYPVLMVFFCLLKEGVHIWLLKHLSACAVSVIDPCPCTPSCLYSSVPLILLCDLVKGDVRFRRGGTEWPFPLGNSLRVESPDGFQTIFIQSTYLQTRREAKTTPMVEHSAGIHLDKAQEGDRCLRNCLWKEEYYMSQKAVLELQK